jgi:dihydrofolate synthase/folylpolyglutamate synthase
VTPRLDQAIDSAVTLAEEEGDLGGAGVLVTGSIVTVAEARTLLCAGPRP